MSLGGSIGIVTPTNTKRTTIENLEPRLQEEFPESYVTYLSWKDGYGSDGVVVEQHVEENILSRFVNSVSVRAVTFEMHQKSSSLISLDKVAALKKKCDIVLDTIDQKMYIAGESVSSKDLHSQTATVTLLNALLENDQHEIRNRDLPRSAYSISKNEMQGKIVLPLIKLVQQRTGKDFEISCVGKESDFFLKITLNADLNIVSLHKNFKS